MQPQNMQEDQNWQEQSKKKPGTGRRAVAHADAVAVEVAPQG